MECLTEVVSQLRYAYHCFRIITVDMEYRSLDSASYVCGVNTCAAVSRRRCEANLIVNNQVNRSANPIALQLTHLKCFSNYALPSKRGITVHKQRQDGVLIFTAFLSLGNDVLLSADNSFKDWINCFKV